MGQAASLSGTRWGLPSVNEQTCGPNKDKPIWSVDQTYRDTAGSIHNSFMGAINTAILMMPNPLDCELITSLRKNAMDRQIAVSFQRQKIKVQVQLFRCVWATRQFPSLVWMRTIPMKSLSMPKCRITSDSLLLVRMHRTNSTSIR